MQPSALQRIRAEARRRGCQSGHGRSSRPRRSTRRDEGSLAGDWSGSDAGWSADLVCACVRARCTRGRTYLSHVFPVDFRAIACVRGSRRARTAGRLGDVVRAQGTRGWRAWAVGVAAVRAGVGVDADGAREARGQAGHARGPISRRGLLARGRRGRESRRCGHVRRARPNPISCDKFVTAPQQEPPTT